MIDEKVNMIVGQVISAVGPVFLRMALNQRSGGTEARSRTSGTSVTVPPPDFGDDSEESSEADNANEIISREGSRVVISLPTFPPEDEETTSADSTTLATSFESSLTNSETTETQTQLPWPTPSYLRRPLRSGTTARVSPEYLEVSVAFLLRHVLLTVPLLHSINQTNSFFFFFLFFHSMQSSLFKHLNIRKSYYRLFNIWSSLIALYLTRSSNMLEDTHCSMCVSLFAPYFWRYVKHISLSLSLYLYSLHIDADYILPTLLNSSCLFFIS